MTLRATCCKVVLLGDSAVGKSCLTVRFVQDRFTEFQEPTIGAAFLAKDLTTEDGNNIKLEIWDTAGQERYRSLAPMYYRGAVAAIVVYDISRKETLIGAKSWISELKKNTPPPGIIIILVANKFDLIHKQTKAEQTKAKREVTDYAIQNDLIYIETSAKSGHNVVALFNKIGEKIPIQKCEVKERSVCLDLRPTTTNKHSRCC